MLNVEVPGTVGADPGAVVGETDPCREEGKKCLEENQVGAEGEITSGAPSIKILASFW